MTKRIGLILGPLLFLVMFFLPIELVNSSADDVIAIAIWMVTWWITECVSISVTALIPLTFFPIFGILDMKTVAPIYASPIIWLFFGGFVMALALEKVNLHRRIALNIVRMTGTSPNRVILGFMIATAFLSMWISNTATTVVMLPIAASVLSLLMSDHDGFTSDDKRFALSLMLGIAYSANVGGIATIIGTPPNAVVVGILEDDYGTSITFLDWLMVGLPFSILMLVIVYLVLVRVVYPNSLSNLSGGKRLIENEISKLGMISKIEKMVILIFILTMTLWVCGKYINNYCELKNWAFRITDSSISMLAAIALFTIPFSLKKSEFILSWDDAKKLPWGILILFGGGLSLAKALSSSGVIKFIGDVVSSNNALPTIVIGALLIAIVLFMTELLSNVALITIFAPVVAGIALALDTELLEFVIPVTIASSCAFMLPMATPPNAIVFASGYVKVKEMVRAGIVLNLISILILIAFMKFIVPLVF